MRPKAMRQLSVSYDSGWQALACMAAARICKPLAALLQLQHELLLCPCSCAVLASRSFKNGLYSGIVGTYQITKLLAG